MRRKQLEAVADAINGIQQQRDHGYPFLSRPYTYSLGDLPACPACAARPERIRVGSLADVVSFQRDPIPVTFTPCGHLFSITVDEASAVTDRYQEQSMNEPVANVQRPPARVYEVRTTHGGIYRAEGDVIESGDGWFTLWADFPTAALALRVPEADVRVVRAIDDAELEAEDDANYNELFDAVHKTLGITPGSPPDVADWLLTACRQLKTSEDARSSLRAALDRIRNLPTEPEVMNADRERPDIWEHGYHCGVLAAKSAARPRNEETTKP